MHAYDRPSVRGLGDDGVWVHLAPFRQAGHPPLLSPGQRGPSLPRCLPLSYGERGICVSHYRPILSPSHRITAFSQKKALPGGIFIRIFSPVVKVEAGARVGGHGGACGCGLCRTGAHSPTPPIALRIRRLGVRVSPSAPVLLQVDGPVTCLGSSFSSSGRILAVPAPVAASSRHAASRHDEGAGPDGPAPCIG
jgi:hypothetical protein